MQCDRCQSLRLVAIQAKANDCHDFLPYNSANEKCYAGYNLPALGLFDDDLGEDYLAFDLCLACGKVQGEFPKQKQDFE